MPDATTARAESANALSTVAASPLPDAARRRGLDDAAWNTLCQSLYPGARPESVLLVVDYCRARKLDPLKKPCHIVPMEVKDARTNTYAWRDVVLPGIYELRTTAQRTGEYLGHAPPTWGPPLEYKGVAAFEFCELTIYRWHAKADGHRIPFTVRVYFREVVALARDGKPNARWSRAPLQMLLKCAEAAALREAFPDELGGERTADEMDGAHTPEHDPSVVDAVPLPPKPDGFDEWLTDLQSTADEGTDKLQATWRATTPNTAEYRKYLVTVDAPLWESTKARALAADDRARAAFIAPGTTAPADPSPESGK
jgi:phage recombination protein Bet